jgi:hypothetical protein
MGFDTSAARVWKRLTREERLAAARHFWADPPREAAGAAQSAVVRALRIRPQSARTLDPERKAVALAGAGEVGELLAASLLVALHLGERRPLLAAFLDGAGLVHDQGLLPDEPGAPSIEEGAARRGYEAASKSFPEDQVRTYLNTLWLQDHDRWAVLDRLVAGPSP